MKTRFAAWRKLDPVMNNVSYFIGTSIDSTGTVWTEGGRVEKVVAARIGGLAKAMMDVVRDQMKIDRSVWEGIFRSDVAEFDFVIQLRREVVKGAVGDGVNGGREQSKIDSHGARANRKLGSEAKLFKNLQLTQQNPVSIDEIGFNAIDLYLADLREIFGHVVLFFYGEGRDVICGLWRPHTFGRREWRVRLGWSSIPIGVEGSAEIKGEEIEEGDGERKVLCEINREAILAEMGMMGEGIVKRIKVKES
jgi:U3 small nucleolar RNA-associated protein 22